MGAWSVSFFDSVASKEEGIAVHGKWVQLS